jgi:hypothetical protein
LGSDVPGMRKDHAEKPGAAVRPLRRQDELWEAGSGVQGLGSKGAIVLLLLTTREERRQRREIRNGPCTQMEADWRNMCPALEYREQGRQNGGDVGGTEFTVSLCGDGRRWFWRDKRGRTVSERRSEGTE